jgi:hypothetical protein
MNTNSPHLQLCPLALLPTNRGEGGGWGERSEGSQGKREMGRRGRKREIVCPKMILAPHFKACYNIVSQTPSTPIKAAFPTKII